MLRSRIAPATIVLAAFIGLAVGVTVAVVRTQPFGVVLKDGRPDRLMDIKETARRQGRAVTMASI